MISRLARFDRRLGRKTQRGLLAGVDEAGRGCLAGPVVVASVVLRPGEHISGVRDSKKLSPARREAAYLKIREAALAVSAVAVSAAQVDSRNVLWASMWGMERAVSRLAVPFDLVLVDGNRLPQGLVQPALALVKGDGRSQVVAAASIVAKVLRDRIMRAWHRHYPEYGFVSHVGYPTVEHVAALSRVGPCPLHRLSFAPVAAAANQLSLPLSKAARPGS